MIPLLPHSSQALFEQFPPLAEEIDIFLMLENNYEACFVENS